jgi:hypothetical protein
MGSSLHCCPRKIYIFLLSSGRDAVQEIDSLILYHFALVLIAPVSLPQ